MNFKSTFDSDSKKMFSTFETLENFHFISIKNVKNTFYNHY